MAEEQWVIKVSEHVRKKPEIAAADENENWKLHSIYKLPACVTDLNEKAYTPRAVSFGPYHYGDPKLMPMESHKDRVLRHFLKRSRKSIDYYVEMVNSVVKDLKDAYDSLDPKWEEDSGAFVELMITDGCFMFEILRASSSDAAGKTTNDYAKDDPIFSSHGKLNMMPYIRRDMLMLENQLPMLLLTKLHSVQDPTKTEEDTNKLIQQFCFPDSDPRILGKCEHVLDVYRKRLLWEEDPKVNRKSTTSPPKEFFRVGDDTIASATELHEAGITIKKSKAGSLKGISFNWGILKLPEIVVDDTFEPVFLNLIAFERFHVGAGNEVTSYISFMDDIIDNAIDVNLLKTRGIIHNAIGSGEAVAQLFNSLSKDITLDPDSSLFAVRKRANRYSKRRGNKWRGYCCHTYFRNPWTGFSLIGAIVLFGLTIVQTIYTIGQYYQAKKP